MDAPPLRQGTSATVKAVPLLGMNGGPVAVVLVKQQFSYDLRGRCTRVDGGAEVQLADIPWDEDAPESSSVKLPSDVCLSKPSTDVVVVGSAVGRDRPSVQALDVIVRVGPVGKALRVFGPRVWYRGGTGLVPTKPERFEELPLRWEHAFGGFDASNPAKPLEEPRNPVGRGLARDPTELLHKPAPAIEDPRELITSHQSKPAPAGVGALGRHWAPRRSYGGTMDERWQRERMPLLPVDFDDRYNQVATPELIAPAPLRGGEVVELHNLCVEGSFRFELPTLHFFVGSHTARGLYEHRAQLDTVLLQPNDKLVDLTFRANVPLPRGGLVRALQVHEKVEL
jgi:hypothetical protein